ncbi:MAG TPA: hypothetical protein DEQ61_00320 [Streptomyces sp.]|nr:hypothetical protein [Streptomyces sp.]
MYQPADHFTLAALSYDIPMATEFLGEARVDRNPHHVSFAYVPASDDRELGLVHDHAYWVSEIRPAGTQPDDGTAPDDGAAVAEPAPVKGLVDAFSHGFGRGDAPSTRGLGSGTEPLPYTEVNRTWGPHPSIPVANRLDLELTDVRSVDIALSRARLNPRAVLTVRAEADSAGEVLLAGRFRDGTRVLRDGKPIEAESGPRGVTLPIVPGDHTYKIVPPGR